MMAVALSAGSSQIGQGRCVDDGQARFAVLKAVAQRLGPEQHGQRHGDCAQLVDRNVSDSRLKALRQDQSHSVAALDPCGAVGPGEPDGLVVQLLVRHHSARSGHYDGGLVG